MMMKSSLKMMRIQPKVDAIKKRYAHLKVNDPKRAEMNTEMMALYKTEGVNMYGGCLPMLLQMPLFFAYFRVLQNAVELRQAHWFWLTDLSQARPAAHSAHPHHPHHVPHAVHHALAGHGPRAAPHDGLHDADHLRLHAVALRFGTGALLGHQQHHQPGHAARHQPIAAGQGDARHCRQASREKSRRQTQRPFKDANRAASTISEPRSGAARAGFALRGHVLVPLDLDAIRSLGVSSYRMGSHKQRSASRARSGRNLSPLAPVSGRRVHPPQLA